MKTYKIVRYYSPNSHKPNETIKTGLVLAEAQEWCSDENTHEPGYFFDGYIEE